MSHQKLNKRNTIRRSISVPIVCIINNKAYKTSTIDLSDSGISIHLDTQFPTGTELSIQLLYDNWQETIGYITRNIFCNTNKSTITGVRFASLELNNILIIRQLLQLPLTINQLNYKEFPYNLNLNNQNHKLISMPSEIEHIFHSVFRNKTYLHIKQDQNNADIESTIASINNKSFTLKIQHEKYCNIAHGHEKLIVYFYHHGSYCIFEAQIISQNHNSYELALPDTIIRLWRRPHPESRLKIIENTLSTITSTEGGKSYSLYLNDIGYEGFSLKIPDPDTIYSIGYSPVSAILPLNDKIITCEAALKYFDEHKYEEGYRCGFEITDISSKNKNILYKFILRQKYQQLLHFNDVSVEEIWGLFYQSGYMIPEKVEHVQKNMDQINDTWSKLYGKNSDIGIMVLYKEKDTVYGSISAAQAYENTWMLHQLAAIKHPTLFIGKLLLYYIYQIVIKHLELDFYKAYFRNDNGWCLQTFLDFRNSCSNKEAVHYDYKDLFEKDLSDYVQKNYTESDFSFEELREEHDIDTVAKFLEKELPEIVCKSENLNREQLFLPITTGKFKKNKLYRERRFILAKKDNEIIAFAILELGSTGINLGGLFDVFQVFTINPNIHNKDLALQQLTDYVTIIYKQYGKKTALCLANKSDNKYLEPLGFKKKLEYVLWHLKREYIIQLIYHLNDFYYNKEKN